MKSSWLRLNPGSIKSGFSSRIIVRVGPERHSEPVFLAVPRQSRSSQTAPLSGACPTTSGDGSETLDIPLEGAPSTQVPDGFSGSNQLRPETPTRAPPTRGVRIHSAAARFLGIPPGHWGRPRPSETGFPWHNTSGGSRWVARERFCLPWPDFSFWPVPPYIRQSSSVI